MKKKIYLFILGISSVIVSVNCQEKKFHIYSLSPFAETDSSNHEAIKYFIVENFNENDSAQIDAIKNYALQQLDKNFRALIFFFYKPSKRLQKEYKQTDQDIILWHSDDRSLSESIGKEYAKPLQEKITICSSL